jgi:pimeloyl-ACP methyl ester carboxylesterase
VREHGEAPFAVAVLHGGPGLPGSVRSLAERLSWSQGVLEPFQHAGSLDGQVDELATTLEGYAEPPVTVVGWSWGAMLGYVLASRHPELVAKLVLVASAAFDEEAAATITRTRIARLDGTDRSEAERLRRRLAGSADVRIARRYAALMQKADSYEPMAVEPELDAWQPRVNRQVWADAVALRKNGELLELGRAITCPVLAVHGDHDPHPAEAVEKPLAAVLADFRFVLLEQCGHIPWLETYAVEPFYDLLEAELPPPPAEPQ